MVSKRKNRNRKKHKTKPTARDRGISLAKVTVQNPDWEPSKDGEPGFPRFEEREKNIKESAIETLYARKFLGSAQKEAAGRFLAYYQAAGGRLGSLDYTMERVDGGKGDPVAGRIIAAQELKRCRDLLGRRGFDTVEAVCAEGKALQELSPHKRERLTMADNLRADLDDLATMWGIQTAMKRNRRA